MNFDLPLISWLAHFANRSWKLDYAVFCISNNDLLKGGCFMALVWFFWFQNPGKSRNREFILSMLSGVLVALVLGKALEVFAPFRQRPYQSSETAGLVFPYDMGMPHESSFPSDHAILFFGLATGLCFISRTAGLAAFLYSIVVISLPRLYLGLHYPTDIIGGGIIGCVCVLVMQNSRLRSLISQPVMNFSEKSPRLFYAGLFVLTFLIGTLFDSARALAAMMRTICAL